MNAILQSVVVFVVVTMAIGYASLKLMPAAWRRAIATKAATWSLHSGVSAATARRVEAKLASGGACGSCDSCKACGTPPMDAAGAQQSIVRRIPIRPV